MGAMVCLDGVGTIAQPATATISSLAGGPATGRHIKYTYTVCMGKLVSVQVKWRV